MMLTSPSLRTEEDLITALVKSESAEAPRKARRKRLPTMTTIKAHCPSQIKQAVSRLSCDGLSHFMQMLSQNQSYSTDVHALFIVRFLLTSRLSQSLLSVSCFPIHHLCSHFTSYTNALTRRSLYIYRWQSHK